MYEQTVIVTGGEQSTNTNIVMTLQGVGNEQYLYVDGVTECDVERPSYCLSIS